MNMIYKRCPEVGKDILCSGGGRMCSTVLLAIVFVLSAGCRGIFAETSSGYQNAALRTGFNERDIERFVYDWFALLDANADVSSLDDFLPSSGFEMVFPDRKISSWEEFKEWYAEDLRKYRRITHDIEKILVKRVSPVEFEADFILFWHGLRFDKWVQSSRVREKWLIADTGLRRPEILSYIIEEVR